MEQGLMSGLVLLKLRVSLIEARTQWTPQPILILDSSQGNSTILVWKFFKTFPALLGPMLSNPKNTC